MEVRPITFHDLYRRYAADVYRFAYWLTGSDADAKDLTSETFVRAWTAAEHPRMETVKAYLFTIARNLHRKQWRRQARLEELDETMPDAALQPTLRRAIRMNTREFGRPSAICQKLTARC